MIESMRSEKLGESEDCEEAVMVGNAYRRDAASVSRYGETPQINFV